MAYEQLPEEYKRFVNSYVHCLNYRKSYQDAYPLITNANTARTNGCLLAAKPEVKQAIIEQLKLYHTEKDDTLQKIIALIQFDVSDFMLSDASLNVSALKEAGYGWIIKAVKPTKFGTEYVLMDKDRALENLAKIHQLFDDKQTVNVNINQEIAAKERLSQDLSTLREKLQSGSITVKS